MAVLPKMSAIMKGLALLSFRNPSTVPSPEAAHAALLFAQVAWNRTLGHEMAVYKELLAVFLRSNPDLWSELRSRDAEALIDIMRRVKEERYPTDRRVVVVCGMRDEKVHVEWCDEKDYPRAAELSKQILESRYGAGRTLGKGRSRQGA
mgnify:CR=1 FL=1